MMAADVSMEAVPIGGHIIAGADVFEHVSLDTWFRREDHSQHRTAEIADFHGHSGWSYTDG